MDEQSWGMPHRGRRELGPHIRNHRSQVTKSRPPKPGSVTLVNGSVPVILYTCVSGKGQVQCAAWPKDPSDPLLYASWLQLTRTPRTLHWSPYWPQIIGIRCYIRGYLGGLGRVYGFGLEFRGEGLRFAVRFLAAEIFQLARLYIHHQAFSF